MTTFSGFKLHLNTITLYRDSSWQRAPLAATESINAVVNDHVRAMLTSAHWNLIVDGSSTRDEIASELARSQPGDRIALQMYKDRIQMALPNRRYVWLVTESKDDLFNQHIQPKTQQMIDRVSELAGFVVKKIYIQVQLPISPTLPGEDPRISDLSPHTSLRLLERKERRGRK